LLKFQIILLEWGYNTKCLDKDNYTKYEILNYKSINYEKEFSDIDKNCNYNRHMGIIVSNNFINKHFDTILVAPITTRNSSDLINHKNKFVLLRENYPKLKNDSVIMLNKIREIDKNRIIKELFFLKDYHHKEFNKRLKFVLGV